MIDWQNLYSTLLETKQSTVGEKHHNKPKHDGGTDEDGLTTLPRRYHILAHYIRYRWLGQLGDKLAFRMMTGQLVNPMHDESVKKKHREIMQTPEQRRKYSKPKTEQTKKAFSTARKKYVATLEDPGVLTQHMRNAESREKARLKRIENNKKNPERVLERAARAGLTRREKNKELTVEELKARYGSPSITNGKWKGYLVIEKDNTKVVFNTIKEAAQNLNMAYSTLLNAIKRGTGTEKTQLYGTSVYLTKTIL